MEDGRYWWALYQLCASTTFYTCGPDYVSNEGIFKVLYVYVCLTLEGGNRG